MPDLDESDRKRLREQLAKYGVKEVKRMLLVDAFPTSMHLEIRKWLREKEASAAKPGRRSAARPRRKPSRELDRVVNEMKATNRAELKKIMVNQESAAKHFGVSRETVRKALEKFLGLDGSHKRLRSYKAMLAILAMLK